MYMKTKKYVSLTASGPKWNSLRMQTSRVLQQIADAIHSTSELTNDNSHGGLHFRQLVITPIAHSSEYLLTRRDHHFFRSKVRKEIFMYLHNYPTRWSRCPIDLVGGVLTDLSFGTRLLAVESLFSRNTAMWDRNIHWLPMGNDRWNMVGSWDNFAQYIFCMGWNRD